ncbi:MAG: Hpt domain-containing protein, partial [Kofleriaceae bacterium]
MLLASVVGAPASAWQLLAADAPTTVTQRRGHVLAVWWEPITDNGVITSVAVFAVRTTDAPIEVEDPVEINRICVDALALLDECEAGLRHLLADHNARHAVHRMFRAMHTIKGSTRGPRLQAISDLAHQTEEAIEILRHTGEPPREILT